jgi:predicted enzyme related to lactoylglutathione lyase
VKLEFLYRPVPDLEQALAFYRDRLGWEEAWREGEATVSLTMPGTEVQLMLDAQPETTPPGPLFVVESVRDLFEARRAEIDFTSEPMAIPGGYLVGFSDPWGNAVYVMDQSEAGEPS